MSEIMDAVQCMRCTTIVDDFSAPISCGEQGCPLRQFAARNAPRVFTQAKSDLTGRERGLLRAVRPVGTRHGQIVWECLCVCGQTILLTRWVFLRGKRTSCGCSSRVRERHGHAAAGKETSEYRTWRAMIQRCHNPRRRSYADYGGRGIAVCERWRNSFLAFLEDVGRKPTARHSLERTNNNKGYAPGNVRWATKAEQSRNTRRNHMVTIDGIEMPLVDAALLYGTSWDLVDCRVRRGWPLERALTVPPRAAALPGVEFVPTGKNKPYRSRIMVGGKRKPLGFFATADEARRAYVTARESDQ